MTKKKRDKSVYTKSLKEKLEDSEEEYYQRKGKKRNRLDRRKKDKQK